MIRKFEIQTIAFILAVIAVAFVLFTFAGTTHANPSSYLRSDAVGRTVGAATTSPAFMTPGTGTSTNTFDSAKGNNFAMDSAVLQLAIVSSTTAPTFFGTTTLALRFEISDNGIDWTTSTSSTLQTGNCEQIASNCTASTSVAMRTIVILTPLRFVRAVIGVNIGSSNNASVWSQWVTKKEN